MDGSGTLNAAESRAVAVARPGRHALPVVVASPHSGHDYPADFIAAARLDPMALRRSEDAHVDALFAGVGALGVPLIKALFPRAYLDPNREAFELDPEMFVDRLPGYVNTRSPRVAAGLGTIPKVVAQGAEIYRGKLYFADALERIERLYSPYHAALRALVDETRAAFGHVVLLDAHSMPSAGSYRGARTGEARAGGAIDIVLGDRHGAACAASVTETAQSWLRGRGYVVACNTPYAGGFTTRHYGRPRQGVHALQIELNRALYMDETTMTPLAGFAALAADMTQLVAALGAIDLGTPGQG
jgi:N-formylglutamate amidohydrolase